MEEVKLGNVADGDVGTMTRDVVHTPGIEGHYRRTVQRYSGRYSKFNNNGSQGNQQHGGSFPMNVISGLNSDRVNTIKTI